MPCRRQFAQAETCYIPPRKKDIFFSLTVAIKDGFIFLMLYCEPSRQFQALKNTVVDGSSVVVRHLGGGRVNDKG